ncbi:MAG: hypothetical protein LUC86_03630 [Prevotellaceae bacterium]|nr:hypothetical protein [Prevotellaceae bacterium]
MRVRLGRRNEKAVLSLVLKLVLWHCWFMRLRELSVGTENAISSEGVSVRLLSTDMRSLCLPMDFSTKAWP